MFWDYWEKYKFQMISAGIILAMLFLWLGIIIAGRTRVNDITLMSQVKAVATGLERYYDQHAAYPVGSNVDLRQNVLVDDGGLSLDTAPPSTSLGTGSIRRGGDAVYYQGAVTAGKVGYSSDGKGYQISFSLSRKWPVVGANKKHCIVRENYQISCS